MVPKVTYSFLHRANAVVDGWMEGGMVCVPLQIVRMMSEEEEEEEQFASSHLLRVLKGTS